MRRNGRAYCRRLRASSPRSHGDADFLNGCRVHANLLPSFPIGRGVCHNSLSPMPIDLLNFVRKWNASSLTERSAASQHFRDLCEALEVPHPTQSDEIGASYTYEKRVAKA